MNGDKNYTKTSVLCYFCNESFASSYLLQAHIKQCSSTLKQCLRCRAYVERRHIDHHANQCLSRGVNKNNASSESNMSEEQLAQHVYTTSSTLPLPRSNGGNQISLADVNQRLITNDKQRQVTNANQMSMAEINQRLIANVKHRQMLDSNQRQVAETNHEQMNDPNQNKMVEVNQRLVPNVTRTDNLSGNHQVLNRQHSRDVQFQQMVAASNGFNSWGSSNGMNSAISHQNLTMQNTRPKSVVYEGESQQILRKEIEYIRQILEQERNHREQLEVEMNKMKRQYILSEERNQILLATISTLRKTIEDEAQKCNSSHSQMTQEVETKMAKYQDLSGRTSRMEMTFVSLQKDIEREQIERSHLDLIVNGQDTKLRVLNKFEADLETLRNDLNQEQQLRREVMAHLQQEASQTKETLAREISINKRQIKDLEVTQNEIVDQLNKHSDDISKYQLLRIESKTMKATLEDDTVKVEAIDKNVKELMDSVATIQRERFTGHLNHGNKSTGSVDSLEYTGHLLWKIDNFEEKLKDSIENESVLLSQIFYTNKYGYALQAELYLNGLGKWRGRHITASVFVIPGKWDPILAWPAQLVANIILKDQTPKRSQSMDIVKTLLVRKKSTQDDFVQSNKSGDSIRGSIGSRSMENLSSVDKEKRNMESNMKKQYVFIPHTNLDKFDYIKNDTAFLEIVVKDS